MFSAVRNIGLVERRRFSAALGEETASHELHEWASSMGIIKMSQPIVLSPPVRGQWAIFNPPGHP